jgi:hypothetical protein
VKRTPIKRSSVPPRKSPVPRSSKPIPKVNVVATAKRKKRHAKDRRSKETQSVYAEAMERAGNRCEFVTEIHAMGDVLRQRCPWTEKLEHHHKSYPKGRRLRASDIAILCDYHHNRISAMTGKRSKVA